jgi:hypothetical protein
MAKNSKFFYTRRSNIRKGTKSRIEKNPVVQVPVVNFVRQI